MSRCMPLDRAILARAVADSVVVASDPDVKTANRTYWERSQPWTLSVVDAIRKHPDATIRSRGENLFAEPTAPVPYFDLKTALLESASSEPTQALFEKAWQAECMSRVGYHLGAKYEPQVPAVSAAELQNASPRPVGGGRSPMVTVVIPFRDRDTQGVRLRNLFACLLALQDQSIPRHDYRVLVIESDESARWRDTVQPYVDQYLFAPKAGPFNRSWAINVAVTNAAEDSELLCILDGDVLVDRDYMARNIARLQRPGTGAHLTYRDMSCLDEASSSAAIRQRLHGGAPDVDVDRLRAFQIRRPPSCSLWLRTEAFRRIHGFDERYEGWGGEDNDFFFRLHLAVPFDTFDDWLLHLHHPPAATVMAGAQKVNARIPWCSWRPEGPIGQRDRFVDESV
ncbi:hypothetical protein LVJ94_39650 [Pendulispora rubella]|uniref:Galactosyltransferase C-terminal domain-containing protein n=1 Tax=Pendulispora rubella TaxID=2741070 RepID=A0ABZ2L193_9BACT